MLESAIRHSDFNYICHHFLVVRFWAYVRGVIGAVAYIDSRGAVHRDIKADNVLIDADDNAKLGDFGLAKKVGSILLL